MDLNEASQLSTSLSKSLSGRKVKSKYNDEVLIVSKIELCKIKDDLFDIKIHFHGRESKGVGLFEYHKDSVSLRYQDFLTIFDLI